MAIAYSHSKSTQGKQTKPAGTTSHSKAAAGKQTKPVNPGHSKSSRYDQQMQSATGGFKEAPPAVQTNPEEGKYRQPK